MKTPSTKHRFIDIGLNLANKQFTSDWRDVVERARDVGVERVVLTGTSVKNSQQCQDLAAQLPDGSAYFTAGVHPHSASLVGRGDMQRLEELLQDPRAVAVGETGLDFDRDFSPRAAQRDSFQRHIELACKTGKPLFLHERCAHEDFLRILDEAGTSLPPCVVHCFTGSRSEAEEYIKRGFYLGITGWAGQARRNADLLLALPVIPADRLLLETDAPYLAPDGYKGKVSRRNEPDAMPAIARCVAAVLRVDLDNFVDTAYRNTVRFFGIAPSLDYSVAGSSRALDAITEGAA
jgi:TatD DNase family protein